MRFPAVWTGAFAHALPSRFSALVLAAFCSGAIGSNAAVFTNPEGIVIEPHGPSTPYPSEIVVSGMGPELGAITVTLTEFNHLFTPDIQIALRSPSGTSVMLMGRESGFIDTTPVTLTFDDDAAVSLPNFGNLDSISYRPTIQPAAPNSSFSNPGPDSWDTTLSAFVGENPNGTWQLFIEDFGVGDGGGIDGGWSLNLTAVPEPAHYAMGVALGLMAWGAYRRNHAASRGITGGRG